MYGHIGAIVYSYVTRSPLGAAVWATVLAVGAANR